MRKAILATLLAATIVPAMAQAQDRDQRYDRREIRDQRQDGRDYRGDWREYRGRHPDLYRGPAWVGPRGYRWRPVTAGYRFDPIFYDRRYWIDPYRYHLRPVVGAQRWVRYGRDVVLVDTRSGRVIEVNNGLFY